MHGLTNLFSQTYDWEPTKANNLLTLFWIVYGVGRAVGIPTTKFIKVTTTEMIDKNKINFSPGSISL